MTRYRTVIYISLAIILSLSLFLIRTPTIKFEKKLYIDAATKNSSFSMFHKSKKDVNRQLQATIQLKRTKPIMHTFFVRIDPNLHIKYTGMSDEADRIMLQHWERFWQRAGWETKILGMSDAAKHPQFEMLEEVLDSGTLNYGYYDRLLFFRWLAMSTVGGGFLSHYDVFPIRKVNFDAVALPFQGKLTIHEETLNGGLASLVSGSKQEFDLAINLIIDSTIESGSKKPFWDEMNCIFDILRHHPNAFLTKHSVLRGEKALNSNRQFLTQEDCWQMASSYWAVHFSHHSISEAKASGNLHESFTFNSRTTVAEGWLNQWAVRCQFVIDNLLDIE